MALVLADTKFVKMCSLLEIGTGGLRINSSPFYLLFNRIGLKWLFQ
jgi:hypothetical protein